MREFIRLAEHGHLFYPDPQEQYQRQEGMRQFVGDYLLGLEEGSIDPGLRSYQREGFPAILKTIHTSLDEPVDPTGPDALSQLSHVQIAEAGMGYGKSFMLATLATAAGMGRLPYEGADQPLRALYLGYSRASVQEIADACRLFAPDVASFHCAQGLRPKGFEKTDVIIMSYAALCRMVEKRAKGVPTPLDGVKIDLIATDENHHRHGPKFGRAVNTLARGKVEVGMTGTRRITEENKDDPVSFRFSMGQMIKTGHGPSVQMLAFPTGKSLAAGSRAPRDWHDALERSYSWEQLKPLALDVERNYQIVELLKMLAANGHTILASMIPGAECSHSRIIKAMTEDEKIIDPITGKKRNVHFEPINGYMPDGEIAELKERIRHPFHVSGLDGLLNTSLITESMDNPNFSAVLATCPMPYTPLAQLAGRLNRGESSQLVVFAQMVDVAPTKYRPAFVGDIYEEAGFFNGMVIGKVESLEPYDPASDWRSKPRRVSGSREEPPAGLIPPAAIKAMIGDKADALDAYIDEWRHTPVFDRTLRADEVPRAKPPEDSIKVLDLYRLSNVQAAGITEETLYTILDSNGFAYSLVHGSGGYVNYAHNKDKVVSFLESYDFKAKPPDRYTRQDLAREFSVGAAVLATEIAKLSQAGEDMGTEPRVIAGVREIPTFSSEQKVLIGAALKKRNEAMQPETDGHPYETLGELAEATRASRGAIRSYAKQVLGSEFPRFISPKQQKRLTYLEPQHALAVRKHFAYPEVPPTAMLLTDICEHCDANEASVRDAFSQIGGANKLVQGRRYIAGKRGEKYGEGFKIEYPFFCADTETIKAVAAYLNQNNVTQDVALAATTTAPAIASTRRRLAPGRTWTDEMPNGYKDPFVELEQRGITCDRWAQAEVVKRVGKQLVGPRTNESGRLFVNEDDISRLETVVRSYKQSNGRQITLKDAVTYVVSTDSGTSPRKTYSTCFTSILVTCRLYRQMVDWDCCESQRVIARPSSSPSTRAASILKIP